MKGRLGEDRGGIGGYLKRISLPGLNRTVFPGGIGTSAPVRGLRPMPLFRGLTTNTPNPRSSMRSPLRMAPRMASKKASTAISDLTLVIPRVVATRLTILALITGFSTLSYIQI